MTLAHRSAPASVIDRARDVASHILIGHYMAAGSGAKDLGDLTARLESDKKYAADILRSLSDR